MCGSCWAAKSEIRKEKTFVVSWKRKKYPVP
jgi:hypothetical protein